MRVNTRIVFVVLFNTFLWAVLILAAWKAWELL